MMYDMQFFTNIKVNGYGPIHGNMYGNTFSVCVCVNTGTPKAEGNVKNCISLPFPENCTQCIHKMEEFYALHSELDNCETPRRPIISKTFIFTSGKNGYSTHFSTANASL